MNISGRSLLALTTKEPPTSSTDDGGGKRREDIDGSRGGLLHPHNAQSGIKVYVDVQDQAVRPSRECAKVRHGFCGYSDTAFNLDSHVVAVAEKKLSHILNCVGWVPHVSCTARSLRQG